MNGPLLFPSSNIPAPPPPEAPPPVLDPNELARRRANDQRNRVTRDSLLIDPGVGGTGAMGTGLKIGQ